MKTIEIIGANHFPVWTERRTACRGIVLEGDKVLLSYETVTDQYMIPGGGTEGQETDQECCRREIAEETGILVEVGKPILTMKEYYEEWLYETHFFLCKALGQTQRKLTPREQRVGMVPRWVSLEEAVSIFSKHQDYAATDEEKRGIYLREYLALEEFVKVRDAENG